MKPRIALVGEVAGWYSYSCTRDDIVDYVDTCHAAGVDTVIAAAYHSPTPEYPGYLAHRDREIRIEPHPYGSVAPLQTLTAEAHRRDIRVVPFLNVATGGQWIRADYLASREVWPYIRLVGGSLQEQAQFWTRTRDGLTWLDIGPRSPVGAFGYLSLAFPEVRSRERKLCSDWSRYGADGIQLEFMVARPPSYSAADRASIPCCDSDGFFAYGYDEPTMTRFKQLFGSDPREVANSDSRWLRVRAEDATAHVREIREAIDRAGVRPELSVFAFSGLFGSPEDGLAVGSDWQTWCSEGLLDAIYCRIPGDFPAFRDRFTSSRLQAMGEEYRRIRRLVPKAVALWPVLELPTYPSSLIDAVGPSEAAQTVKAWSETMIDAGASQLGYWNADTVRHFDLWSTLLECRQLLED